jgi:hypothetical protein
VLRNRDIAECGCSGVFSSGGVLAKSGRCSQYCARIVNGSFSVDGS